ncbi:MAG: rRNA maturation RNase YbeY [Xanthomonadales bacterium]|nr:rRNA maturation RNase YbeY [Xanthomonadales bacterium]
MSADSLIRVDLSVDADVDPELVPDAALLRRWIANALGPREHPTVIDLRVVGEAAMTELNGTFRGKARPTNVLSFPAEPLPGGEFPILGDLALCAPVLAREATEQGKPLDHHWAHLLTHGVLHLLGHDHQDETEAERMEALEIERLAALGIPDPYGDD